MFKNLTQFSLKRSNKEALGFYIAWVIFIMILAMFAGGLLGLFSSAEKGESFDMGMRVGAITAIIVSGFMSFLVLKSKKRLSDFSSLVYILLSGVMGFVGGGLLGMLIPSFLTTKDSK